MTTLAEQLERLAGECANGLGMEAFHYVGYVNRPTMQLTRLLHDNLPQIIAALRAGDEQGNG